MNESLKPERSEASGGEGVPPVMTGDPGRDAVGSSRGNAPLEADLGIGVGASSARMKLGYWGWLLGMGVIVAGLVLWRIEPRGQVFYPPCMIYASTGWQCPGCGGLRAVHALLNGRIGEAFRMNPLLVLYLPLGMWAGVSWVMGRWRGVHLPNPLGNPVFIAVLVGVAFGFALVRNLPVGRWLGF